MALKQWFEKYQIVIALLLLISVIILLFGVIFTVADSIYETPVMFKNQQGNCDSCLQQYDDFNCTWNTIGKVCQAIREEPCQSNCTVNLQS